MASIASIAHGAVAASIVNQHRSMSVKGRCVLMMEMRNH